MNDKALPRKSTIPNKKDPSLPKQQTNSKQPLNETENRFGVLLCHEKMCISDKYIEYKRFANDEKYTRTKEKTLDRDRYKHTSKQYI